MRRLVLSSRRRSDIRGGIWEVGRVIWVPEDMCSKIWMLCKIYVKITNKYIIVLIREKRYTGVTKRYIGITKRIYLRRSCLGLLLGFSQQTHSG